MKYDALRFILFFVCTFTFSYFLSLSLFFFFSRPFILNRVERKPKAAIDRLQEMRKIAVERQRHDVLLPNGTYRERETSTTLNFFFIVSVFHTIDSKTEHSYSKYIMRSYLLLLLLVIFVTIVSAIDEQELMLYEQEKELEEREKVLEEDKKSSANEYEYNNEYEYEGTGDYEYEGTNEYESEYTNEHEY